MIQNNILSLQEMCDTIAKNKQDGHTIILAHGVFDLLHQGHVALLVQAKQLGDILVVGIEPDANTKLLKGSDRPIHHVQARSFVIANLAPVDYVFIIPTLHAKTSKQQFYHELYERLRPDIVATSVKAGKHGLLKRTNADSVGAKFVDLDTVYEKNTTKIIAQLKLK